MTTRPDSYASPSKVRAQVRHLLDGENNFSENTRPTLVDVENILDRVSAVLNLALIGAGYAIPLTNSTAILACEDFVIREAARQVELTQRGTGFNGEDDYRLSGMDAREWVDSMASGFAKIGITELVPASSGFSFTGMPAPEYREDRSNLSLAQPKFRRGLFDG